MQKNELRKLFLKKRDALSEIEIKTKSKQILNRIFEMKEFEQAQTVFAYMSINSEVDMSELIRRCWELNKIVCMPKTITKTKEMHFYAIKSFENLRKSNYGIMEPYEGEIITPDDKTMVVVPGVAFDYNMARIGYGGGYYDRFLAKYSPMAKIGVCFLSQMADKLEIDANDVCVDKIITESHIIMKKG